jgi:type I restriction enzyme, S subunit
VIEPVEGFEMVNLGDLVNITTGKNTTPDNKSGSLYPYYGPSGITGYTDHYLEDGEYLLTARNCSIGNTFFINGRTFPSDNMFILKSNTNMLNLKYLYYYTSSNKSKFQHLANTTTVPSISKTSLQSIEIPLPSLKKQQEIVEAIDRYAELARLEEEGLKLLEKTSIFRVKESCRGKPFVKLGDICDFASGKGVKKENRSTTGTVPYYGANGIIGYMDNGNFNGKHIITGKDGTLGTFYNVHGAFWASEHTHVIKPKCKSVCNHDMLYYILKVYFDKDKLQTGSCIPSITLNYISDFEIPLPPIEEQQKLIAEFDAIVDEMNHKRKKIAEYNARMNAPFRDFINETHPL